MMVLCARIRVCTLGIWPNKNTSMFPVASPIAVSFDMFSYFFKSKRNQKLAMHLFLINRTGRNKQKYSDIGKGPTLLDICFTNIDHIQILILVFCMFCFVLVFVLALLKS